MPMVIFHLPCADPFSVLLYALGGWPLQISSPGLPCQLISSFVWPIGSTGRRWKVGRREKLEYFFPSPSGSSCIPPAWWPFFLGGGSRFLSGNTFPLPVPKDGNDSPLLLVSECLSISYLFLWPSQHVGKSSIKSAVNSVLCDTWN